jgi:hypothetical protein
LQELFFVGGIFLLFLMPFSPPKHASSLYIHLKNPCFVLHSPVAKAAWETQPAGEDGRLAPKMAVPAAARA